MSDEPAAVVAAGEKPPRPAAPPSVQAPADTDQAQQPTQNISRLNSLSERVSGVTDRTKKFILSTKTSTPATKKTLDGVLIDSRLTEPTGILYKAKMIGSLSVQFHRGDKMAIDAMRDLKVMAKTSGRHKARVFLRISIQGIHILEDGTMKQIDIHDLDKISYLAEDPDDKNVFAYIYNKPIRNKGTGKTSTAHRLFAIKSPKCGLIVSNMKAVFHYMYDMRMSDNKPDTINVDMAEAKREAVLAAEVEASAPDEEQQSETPEGHDTLGFDYGKLVDLAEPEDLVKPVVAPDPELYPEEEETFPRSELDPGPAVNLYVTSPRGNRLEVFEDEPVYSTVRKIRVEPTEAEVRPSSAVIACDFGIVNPSWNKSEANSIDEDIFSLDKYNRQASTSSDEDEEEEHTFGVAPPAPARIPSAVFLDNLDFEWDGGDAPQRYSEGQFELAESRERLSTVTKKAVASLERVREEQKQEPAAADSLIDFATFEDRLETSDALDLFDTLKEKPAAANNTGNTRPQNDDLLSLDFSGFGTVTPPTQQATVQPTAETQKYNIDITSLLADPNSYKNTSMTGSSQSLNSNPPPNAWVGFPTPAGPANPAVMTTGGMTAGGMATGGMTASTMPTRTSPGGSGYTTPNYQPTYNFPVTFGAPSDNLLQPTDGAGATRKVSNTSNPRKVSNTSNPFHAQKTTTTSTYDPFSDLINDAI